MKKALNAAAPLRCLKPKLTGLGALSKGRLSVEQRGSGFYFYWCFPPSWNGLYSTLVSSD